MSRKSFGEQLSANVAKMQRRREKEAIRNAEQDHERAVAIRKMKEQGLWQ